jgi:hypothetical protein
VLKAAGKHAVHVVYGRLSPVLTFPREFIDHEAIDNLLNTGEIGDIPEQDVMLLRRRQSTVEIHHTAPTCDLEFVEIDAPVLR